MGTLDFIGETCACAAGMVFHPRRFRLGDSLLAFQRAAYDGLAVVSGVGFLLAMFLFAGVRSKIEDNDYPECFKGVASTLVAASILSVSFMGFSGMIDSIFGM